MDYEDDYEEFDDYDYDDAADDWEAEAELEEEHSRAEAEARAKREDKKLATRAPVNKQKPKDEEEVLPADVQKEVGEMRQIANDIGSSDFTGGIELIADHPVDSPADAKEVGQLVADRILQFRRMPNFNVMLLALFEGVGKEFKTVEVINSESAKVHVAMEELKRSQKTQKKKKDTTTVRQTKDALDFGQVDDRTAAGDDDADAFF